MVNAEVPPLRTWRGIIRPIRGRSRKLATLTQHRSPAARRGTRRKRRAGHSPLLAPLVVFGVLIVFGAAYVAYVLWPRWPDSPVALDAPTVPIVVSGTVFNIEPAAIRMNVQRRPGAHERVDLSYLWPSLTPPDPAIKPTVGAPIDPNERLFVTIASGDTTLPLMERVQTIYPRYLVAEPVAGPPGLTFRGFRSETPYQGEDLVFEFERARALPRPLLAKGRHKFGHLPAGKAYRQRRRHTTLSARLAGQMVRRRQRNRSPDRQAASGREVAGFPTSCPHLLRASTSSRRHKLRRGWPGRARP